MQDVVGDFRQRWRMLWGKFGITGPGCEYLIQRYQEAHRRYHDISHIVACFRELDGHAAAQGELMDRFAIELAIFFHDAVYDPRGKDNEAASAALAREELSSLLPAVMVQRVAQLIQVTDHRSPVTDIGAELIVDVDLSILGRPWEEFERYELAIREEYAFVPDLKFRKGRTLILNTFMMRPTIYRTEHFRALYEDSARSNLRKSLAQLA